MITATIAKNKWWILAAIILPLLVAGLTYSHPYWPSSIDAREVDFAVLDEVLEGVWDGEKTVFSTKYVPNPETLQIYLNGKPISLMIKHSTDDTGNIALTTVFPKKTVVSASYIHSKKTKER